ncbi:hypothetical protein LZ24_01288 [Desulfobotulus alkaliphilus]|uniref:Uncharacterized protein n=1 Tax=Desulfobotulus alkaliphilus TaxID=622671 RepID=A0A562RVU9_9BACT|nr:hypothetical protein [Desulfobotulus alkaliphilus]TWI73201.1 hypothetical protein LZ24_01288 [Desulfobotulus alkaliphilus]
MAASESVYHYTTGKALAGILAAGVIRTSPSFSPRERAVVWCSALEDWEPSAGCVHTLPDGRVIRRTKEEIRRAEGGLGRIRIAGEAKLFTFEQYKRISKISNRHLRVLQQFAEACGADIRFWRVSLVPLNRVFWESVEMQHPVDGSWMPHPVQKKEALREVLADIQTHLPFMDTARQQRLYGQLARLEKKY